ncbi:hypothetical protein EK21DRAFT_73176, partial [Setomelanomma holmii]
QCDGYEIPTEEYQIQVWSSDKLGSLQNTVSTYSGFGNGVRYLEFYHHCARPSLASHFDNDFWSRIALQLAHSEPSVRHALIALGYLHSTETGSLRHARSRFAGQRESGVLLYHYNKSVRSLVDRIGESSYSPEIGLVTCLLFVCMEFLRGNYHTAFQHLTNGYKIITEYQEKKQLTFAPSPQSMTSQTSSASSFSLNTMIEDELRPIFVRAMASALLYGVEADASLEIPEPSLQHYKQLRIENIREAQLSAFELRNQSIILIRNLSRRIFHEHDKPLIPEEIEQQQQMLQCQQAWFASLQEFRQTIRLSRNEELAVSALITHYYATHIWAACAHEFRQTPFDDHLAGFQDIIKHAGLILDSQDLHTSQPAARFTFEISLIPVIYFVATRCRCPATRREAVKLLERKPPREGLFDAEQHVVVTKRVIEIEEEEVDPITGWPVERTRLWSSVIDANMDRNGGFWAYFMPSSSAFQKTPDGKPRLRQEFFIL